jgi:hypothetical protein
MSVYGDREYGQLIAVANGYGSDKRRSEKLVRSTCARHGREAFIFRLGHVCGELQGITRQIRRALHAGPIRLPDPERPSNTVHVVTIADAIIKVAQGRVTPGTYDLMNVPQWTWREAFEHEGKRLAVQPRFEIAAPARASIGGVLHRMAGSLIFAMANSDAVRRVGSRVVPRLPMRWYRRVKADYSTRAAAAEIRRLRVKDALALDAVLRSPVGSTFAPALENTASLLARAEYQVDTACAVGARPSDLPWFDARVTTMQAAPACEPILEQPDGTRLS